MLNGSDIAMDLHAEAQLLGAVFARADVLGMVPDLEPDHFFDLKHRLVFSAIRNLQAANVEPTIARVEERLAADGNAQALDMYGRGHAEPRAFLERLVENAPAVNGNAASAATTIGMLDKHLRELTLDRKRMLTRRDAPKSAPLITIGDALQQLVTIGEAPVYTTPFPTLNEALGFGGLLGGQPYTLAAGTGRGKTSFVGQLAMHHGTSGDVLIAIYEAFAGYNVARMAAGPLGLHSNAIIREAGKHGGAVLRALPPRIYFLDRPTPARIREATDQLSQRAGVAPLVIVDYGQKLADMVQAQQQRPDARLAMSETSAELLDLAASTKAAVLTVSATSRMNSKRTQDPRKVAPYELVDVAKESGAIEYDTAALIVLSLSDEIEGDERVATATVAKARFGEEMHIDMRFDGKRGAWRDLGRVERSTARKAIEVPTRDKLIASLRITPADSATALVKRCNVQRKEGFAEIRALEAEGIVIRTEEGLEIAP